MASKSLTHFKNPLFSILLLVLIFIYLFIFWFCDYSCPNFFLPSIPLCCVPPSLPPAFPHLSSCPWVVHISSLTSPFLYYSYLPLFILWLTIMLLIPCKLSPFLPHYPADNPPCDLNFCDSVPLVVVCCVCFCFLGSLVDSCVFVVISLFIVLIFSYFLDKSF